MVRFCELQKASGITPWKMLLATALALLITGCAQQTFTVQNNRQQHQRKPSPIISSFLELGRRKLSMHKICGGAENKKENRKPSNIRKWIARFYYFRHLYSAGSVWLFQLLSHELPNDKATLSALLINILLWVPSSCFCIVISLSEGEIIPFSGVCQSGEAASSTPEAVVASRTDWQTALMCNRRRPAATSSRRASFSALASANSSCILHRAQQHHADASACQ